MIRRSGQLFTLRSLVGHPRVTREEIVAFQNAQLRRLVAHAYTNVPYYRALLDDNGVKPRDIEGAADLARIPVTTRRALQALEPRDVVARGTDPERLLVHRTSGSSGEPLTIRRSWFEERLYVFARLRVWRALGLRVRDRQAIIGIQRPPDPRDVQLPQRVLRAAGLFRKVRVDCLLPPGELARILAEIRPDVIQAFPGVLSRVAQVGAEECLESARPRFVAVGGEVLTPLMRRQIGEAFRAPVFELYGSHEFRLIAWQCPATGNLHVRDDSVLLEVLKDGRPVGPGESGEVVGTALHSFAMPFLRYRLGDIVTRGPVPCACGAPFSTIRTVQGRMIDYFRLPGGRLVHPYELVVPLLSQPWVRQYQLVQEREDRVTLRVATTTAPSPQAVAATEESTRALLDPGVEFRILLVPDIPLDPNGKFRPSRSLVSSDYDGIDWDRLRSAAPSQADTDRG